jgi:hypothetical protein
MAADLPCDVRLPVRWKRENKGRTLFASETPWKFRRFVWVDRALTRFWRPQRRRWSSLGSTFPCPTHGRITSRHDHLERIQRELRVGGCSLPPAMLSRGRPGWSGRDRRPPAPLVPECLGHVARVRFLVSQDCFPLMSLRRGLELSYD